MIRLRINVDKHNLPDAWRLLDFFAEQGWLGADVPFYPYWRVFRLSPTPPWPPRFVRSMSFRKPIRWMKRLHEYGVPVAFQALSVSGTELYNCGAISNNGFIFNPNGEIISVVWQLTIQRKRLACWARSSTAVTRMR